MTSANTGGGRRLFYAPPGLAGVDGALPLPADLGGGGGGGGGVGAFFPSGGVALPPGVATAFAAPGLPGGGGGGGGGGGSEADFLLEAGGGGGSGGARGGGDRPFLKPDGGGGGGGGGGGVAFADCRNGVTTNVAGHMPDTCCHTSEASTCSGLVVLSTPHVCMPATSLCEPCEWWLTSIHSRSFAPLSC